MGDQIAANGSAADVSEEARLARVLEALRAALDDGPNIDLKTLAAEHPSIADHLRSCLTVLCSPEASERGPSWDPEAANDEEPMVLGDFLVVRSIARGGMGIVFEAQQISLRRKVALKVLPFAAALDDQHVRRFEIEAQAAAQLHHANIVPIFAVGCDRGVHYYAMQFIEGQTLAAQIHELQVESGAVDSSPDSSATAPQGPATTVYIPGRHGESEAASPLPSPSDSKPAAADVLSTLPRLSRSSPRKPDHYRTVAEVGLQAALALEYAHRQGVIHRDVKPSNLMIDLRGNLWVTDFGLARFGEDRGLTMTGDLLGTLRYMSPEQALGQRAFVDHRTDVYSLAATLYEYTTLAPAVPGTTHQDILRRIADHEPVPARRVDPKVPHELETILQKAMNREVEGRYATAQEMADDLRRFLEDKTILAKPPTWWDRAVKWGRRHPSLVASALATLMLAVVMLAVSIVLIGRAHDATKDALGLAKKNAETARLEAEIAADNAYWVLNGITEPIKKLANPDLDRDPKFVSARRDVVDEAVSCYHEYLKTLEGEGRTVEEAPEIWLRIALLYTAADDFEGTKDAYRKAIEAARKLLADGPTAPRWNELGRGHFHLGAELWLHGEKEAAVPHLRGGIEMSRKAMNLAPDDIAILQYAAWQRLFCPLVEIREPEVALQAARRLVEVTSEKVHNRKTQAGGIRPFMTLALAEYRNGNLETARDAAEHSMKIRDGGDAYEWFVLSMILARQGELDRARTLYHEAVQWTKRYRYGDFELHFLDDEAAVLLKPQPDTTEPPTPLS
ncbi:serine/threonine-protein kinase [Paludisphaera borealis]|uniref:serine/threonine-protein kinase n=1 Tax=Paludisphaera borealis TaxID=1387353 RepID=UPI001AEF3DB4|nr:serine/threonine-protein kinase [Paludisphaera borealis]